MNTLASCNIAGPKGADIECAQFTIEDTESPFVLSDIMTIDTRYAFSFYIRSDNDYTIRAAGYPFTSSTDWQQHSVVFESTSKDLTIRFIDTGVYYIYHPQLEHGNVVTDWTPAPEDTVDDINAIINTVDDTNETVRKFTEDFAELSISNDLLTQTVGTVTTSVDELSNAVSDTRKQFTEVTQTYDKWVISVQDIVENGATSVSNTTGTFDEKGLTVDNNNSPTKTTVTPDGMTVYKKESDDDLSEVLTATSNGVNATNLHASTFLIIGERSRFENYGTNRTGCFWIGG